VTPWVMQTGLLPALTCQDMIDWASHGPALSAGTVTAEGIVDERVRRSRASFPLQAGRQHEAIDQADRWARMMADELGCILSLDGHAEWQYSRYEPGAYYAEHMDALHLGDRAPAGRKLSVVVQLTEAWEYTGGSLRLSHCTAPDRAELRERGTIIAFPSWLPHQVTPVEAGVRHSLVGWLHGPPWQ